MKIQEQFIPLILDGTKKYEFRNSDDREGFYKINNKLFFLKYHNTIWSKTIPNERYKTFAQYLRNHFRSEVNAKNDKETFKWLKEFGNEYFRDKKEQNIHCCFIYEWINLEKLEVCEEKISGSYIYKDFPLTDFLNHLIKNNFLNNEEVKEPLIKIINSCLKKEKNIKQIELLNNELFYEWVDNMKKANEQYDNNNQNQNDQQSSSQSQKKVKYEI